MVVNGWQPGQDWSLAALVHNSLGWPGFARRLDFDGRITGIVLGSDSTLGTGSGNELKVISVFTGTAARLVACRFQLPSEHSVAGAVWRVASANYPSLSLMVSLNSWHRTQVPCGSYCSSRCFCCSCCNIAYLWILLAIDIAGLSVRLLGLTP